MTEFKSRLLEIAAQIHSCIDLIIPPARGPESLLIKAMRHAALNGGKRLRPYLVIETGRLFKANEKSLIRASSALECIHAYSLIHDDLPCMDDDDTRRGQPSLHKIYGEATAMLAGDSLLTLAFDILANPITHADAKLRCKLVTAASQRAGITGMTGGQMIDILVKNQENEPDMLLLTRMLRMKTGSLFSLAADFGAILGHADTQERHALAGYTHDLGLAYQIADDIKDTDHNGIVGQLGQTTALERLRLLTSQAQQHLAPFGPEAEPLLQLAAFVGSREKQEPPHA